MSLVTTLMQPIRTKYEPKTLDKNEIRESRYGAWDFFVDQTQSPNGLLTPAQKTAISRSFGNTVQIPVLDARDVTISNVRSCTVADSENTSKLVGVTFVTYSFGFTMTPAQHYNNDVGYQADFDRKLETYLLKLASVLDTAAVSALNTNRNQYFPAAITSYYPVVGNALQVGDDQKNDFYNQLHAIQAEMDYYGKLNVISSTSGMPLKNRLEAQGAGNATNEAFQFLGYSWYFSNRVTNGTGIRSTNFAVPDGYVATMNRNDPDAVAGSKAGSKEWGVERMPIVNLDMGTYYYADCADRSALHAGTTGLTRTLLEGFEFSTDVAFITAYNSAPTTRYSPILKTEISATAAPTT